MNQKSKILIISSLLVASVSYLYDLYTYTIIVIYYIFSMYECMLYIRVRH